MTRQANATKPARSATIRGTIARQLSHDRVLQAAAQVFSERDVDDVSVEDLLVAASVSRRTFYKMFASKEDVLGALYEMVSRVMLESADTALSGATTLPEAVDQSIDMFLGLAASDGRLMRALEVESLRPGSRAATLRESNLQQLTSALVARVRAETQREIDPLVVRGVLWSLEGLSLLIRAPEAIADESLRERVRAAAQRIARASLGLGPPHAPV